MTEQIAVRLPDELIVELDRLVSTGRYASRAAAVRAGVESVTRAERARDLDRKIVAGYRARPPSPTEIDAATSSLREAIAEEPW